MPYLSLLMLGTWNWLSGKTDYTGELTEKEILRFERNSGVVSSRVREIQVSSKL